MIAYLDSSAIIKWYVADEGGTAQLEAIVTRSSRLATARLTYVEVRAGLAAARRANRLARMDHDHAVESFDSSWEALLIVELSETVGTRAGSIADAFGLRAGDAIQLASAMALDAEDTVLVAWDARLRFAARAAGVATYPAEG